MWVVCLVQHRDNFVPNGSIHPLSHTILDRDLRSCKLSPNGSKLTPLSECKAQSFILFSNSTEASRFLNVGSYIQFFKNRSNVDDMTSIWRMTKVRKQWLRYCFGTKIISNKTFFSGFILNNKSLGEGWIALCKTENKYIKNVMECSRTLKLGVMFYQCICINTLLLLTNYSIN